MLAGLGAALSLRLGRTYYLALGIVLGNLLPSVIVGSLQGIGAAWFIRHRKLSLAMLPAILCCLFLALYFTIMPMPDFMGGLLFDMVIMSSLLLLLVASFLCARFVLRRREKNLGERHP